jgi:hypothetical protein
VECGAVADERLQDVFAALQCEATTNLSMNYRPTLALPEQAIPMAQPQALQ